MSSKKDCPLCFSISCSHFFHQEKWNRDFYRCSDCDLIFVDRKQLVSKLDEQARYNLHDNSKRTKGYESFLMRLVEPVIKYTSPSSSGLDFGEGPYPMLRELLGEKGFRNVRGYDPYYNKVNLESIGHLDFITCCEVIEHMSKPKKDIDTLINLLNKDALLVISTGIFGEKIKFSNWHYINDETHINIFSDKTLDYIALTNDLEIIEKDEDLRVFSKR